MIDALEPEVGSIGYATMAIKAITEKAQDGKTADPGRFFSGYLNANTIDREEEIYVPTGIDTKAFMNTGGPIYPRHYDAVTGSGESCMVARVLSISKREDGLFVNKAEFDTDPLSEHWKGKVQRGFIKAMSAGFLRREVEVREKNGRKVYVVTRSELIHGVLTSQPVNRESLITGVKSVDRLTALERQLDAIKSASVPMDRFEELTGSIELISEQLAALSVALKSTETPKPPERTELDRLASSMADLAKQAAQIARVNTAA